MPGAERLRDSAALMGLVTKQAQADKPYAAICATPAVAFEPNGGWAHACMWLGKAQARIVWLSAAPAWFAHRALLPGIHPSLLGLERLNLCMRWVG